MARYTDEDWPDDDGTAVAACDHCGETRPCRSRDDPFTSEVHPGEPNPPSWWCYSCWLGRKEDV